MTQKIFVMNTRDRYYNGAYKGGILQIDADKKEEYLRVGFVEISDNKIIPKNNIVDTNKDGKATVEELKKFLDHNGIEYPSKANKDDLQKLVDEFNAQSKKADNDGNSTENLRNELIEAKIISETDAKTDEEIMQIARENGFVE